MSRVIAAIIVEVRHGEPRLLLTLRDAGAPYEGLWESPGGKVVGDETVMQCIMREVYEELGLTVSWKRHVAEIPLAGGGSIQFAVVERTPDDVDPSPKVAKALGWFSVSDLLNFEEKDALTPGNFAANQKIIEYMTTFAGG